MTLIAWRHVVPEELGTNQQPEMFENRLVGSLTRERVLAVLRNHME